MKGVDQMKKSTVAKRIIDVALTVTLLLLMAFQVTEQLAHEWLGIAMFALTVAHQILNRKYYAAIFKGKYNALRILQLTVNCLLLLSFVCTALSGMMMSRFATPFMNGILPSSIVRQGHLAMSHWSFVLMGLHLGLHFGIITSKLKNKTARIILGIVMTVISVFGFYLFFKSDMLSYMLFKNKGVVARDTREPRDAARVGLRSVSAVAFSQIRHKEGEEIIGSVVSPFVSRGHRKRHRIECGIEPCSVGTTLSDDVAAWLQANGMK